MLKRFRQALAHNGTVSFSIRVHPGVPRTRAKGMLANGTLKIDIAAAPEDGKANAELVRFLAGEFGVPKSHVSILKGLTAKTKVVRVQRMSVIPAPSVSSAPPRCVP